MITQVLAIAMALSYGTMDFIEGAVITAVILLNIGLGYVRGTLLSVISKH